MFNIYVQPVWFRQTFIAPFLLPPKLVNILMHNNMLGGICFINAYLGGLTASKVHHRTSFHT